MIIICSQFQVQFIHNTISFRHPDVFKKLYITMSAFFKCGGVSEALSFCR